MVDLYAVVLFWTVVSCFSYILIAHPRFFRKKSTNIGFHTLSLGVFIIYMYESGEYTNDEVHKVAKRLGVHITNRQVGITVLLAILMYTVFKTYSVVN